MVMIVVMKTMITTIKIYDAIMMVWEFQNSQKTKKIRMVSSLTPENVDVQLDLSVSESASPRLARIRFFSAGKS